MVDISDLKIRQLFIARKNLDDLERIAAKQQKRFSEIEKKTIPG